MRLLSETQAPRRFAVTVRTMQTNSLAIRTAAGIAALGLALAGCSNADSDDGSGDGQSSPAASADSDAGTSDEASEPTADDDTAGEDANSDSSALPADADLSKDSASVSPEDAIDTALKETGDGIVHGIELDWDETDSAWQYEVSILDGTTDHDIEIDAESGKIVDHDKDSTDDEEKAIDLTDPMTFDEALELAQEKSSGRLVGWKLEYDDGQREFQFDFEHDGEETETTVDVETERVTVDDD
jgi:uncharacterized membrane protein YkoI